MKNLVSDYLAAEVNFGGVRMPRIQMLKELERMAKETDPQNWQALVNAYLGGLRQKEERDAE